MTREDDLRVPGPPAPPSGPSDDDVDVELETRRIPVIGDPLDHLGSMTLVGLGAPSILQVAHDTRRLATAAPLDAGAIQDRLWRALGAPRAPAAVPIAVEAGIAAVIAVGDPIGDLPGANDDLERLGRALGAAFRRITGR